jgi:hypothetical protein
MPGQKNSQVTMRRAGRRLQFQCASQFDLGLAELAIF